jgi:hypothetical protein
LISSQMRDPHEPQADHGDVDGGFWCSNGIIAHGLGVWKCNGFLLEESFRQLPGAADICYSLFAGLSFDDYGPIELKRD